VALQHFVERMEPSSIRPSRHCGRGDLPTDVQDGIDLFVVAADSQDRGEQKIQRPSSLRSSFSSSSFFFWTGAALGVRGGKQQQRPLLVLLILLVGWHQLISQSSAVGAFTCVPILGQQMLLFREPGVLVAPLNAVVDDSNNKKRRKRKRKDQISDDEITTASTLTSTTMEEGRAPLTTIKNVPQRGAAITAAASVVVSSIVDEEDEEEEADVEDDDDPVDINLLNDIANFKFDPSQFDATSTSPPPSADPAAFVVTNKAATTASTSTRTTTTTTTGGNRGTSLPLPDIKEARKLKQLEEELASKAEKEESNKVRINRSDKEAFRKVRYMVFIASHDQVFLHCELFFVRKKKRKQTHSLSTWTTT
jgi:hypothetical protein